MKKALAKICIAGLAVLFCVSCGKTDPQEEEKGNSKVEFEAVDLGLPSGLKWANMNLQAESPEDYGGYFSWGETAAKTYFTADGYKWYDEAKYRTKYDFREGKASLDTDDDAAHAILGKNWRMPTQEEFQELIQNCDCSWSKQAGVNGLLVKSKKNGKTIFLPSAGVMNGHSKGAFEIGRYWTSNLLTEGANYYAVVMMFSESDCRIDSFPCDRGLVIRPVTK